MNNDKAAIEREKRNYARFVQKITPSTSAVKSLVNAFWIGGLTCVTGQVIGDLYALLLPKESVRFIANLTSATLIVLAILFTGFGFYDVIARRGGAGSFLPITGFANAMASPAIDAKAEGWILGVGAKTFNVAGPVILYGTLASVLYGVIYYIVGLF